MKRFRDIAVRDKILLGYFGILVFFLGLGIYYINVTRKISQESRKIELHNFAEVELVGEIEINVFILKNLVHEIYFLLSEQQLTDIRNQIDIYSSKITQLLSELEDLVKRDSDDTKSLLTIKNLFIGYKNLIYEELEKGLKEKVYWGLHEAVVLKHLEEELRDLRNENISTLSLALGNIDYLARKIRRSYIWSLLILIFLSILFACRCARIIVKPIMDLVMGMRKLGGGNLDYKIEIKSNDEIGALQSGFMAMAGRLKQAHDALENERASLEVKVKERTKDLEGMQAQLIQSAKMAAVGLLAGGIAHEINNPLTGVLNNVELINLELEDKKDIAPSDFKKLLGIIEESALRCKRIVQGLLDFSRIGKVALEPASINEVLEKAIFLAGNELKIENIKIIEELDTRRPSARINVNRFQQVILDIINNSKWALRDKPGAELKVKSLFSEDNKSVIVEISDNGCGIDKEKLSHIFDPFFTTKDVGDGTGLGLFISYQIIQEHNGIIEAESAGVGKGMTIRIKLPR